MIQKINSKTSFALFISVLLVAVPSLTYAQDEYEVPDWVKNTAGWWATDAISEKEFVNAIEFLVNEGVINVGENCVFKKSEYNHLTKITPLNQYDAKKLLCFEYELSFLEEFIEPGNWKDGLKTNSLGFRGAEVSIEKPNDIYRIFMVGGSTTYSVLVPDDQTIPVLTQKLIEQEKIPFEIEMINAGISGADSFNEIDVITQQLIKYEPDLIIVYDGWNEVVHAAKSPEKNNAEKWEESWTDTCKDLEKKVDIIITLQPFLGVGNKLLTDQESNNFNGAVMVRNHGQKINELDNYANKLNEIKEECANAYDLRYIFDDYNIPVYFDYGHVNSDGNKIIANNIFKIIVEHLSLESSYPIIPQYDVVTQNHKKIIVKNELDFRGKLINSKDFSNGNFKNAVFHLSNIENVNFENSDLTNADFRFAKINNVNFKNTNLTGANFAGSEVVSSNFLNSDMTKTYVSGGFFVVNDLSNSIITDANWRGVIFERNIVDNTRISNSDFSKSYIKEVNFNVANISEIKLNGATIIQAELDNFDFSNTDSTIDGYTDVGIYKGTYIQASNVRGVNLSNMDLSGIIFAPQILSGKTFVGIDLANSNLSNSSFEGSVFSFNEASTFLEAVKNDKEYLNFLRKIAPNLSGANLANAKNLQGINFNLVNLIGTDLTNVNLKDSTVVFANLEGANLEGANVEGANLEGANLEGANLNCINHEICN